MRFFLLHSFGFEEREENEVDRKITLCDFTNFFL